MGQDRYSTFPGGYLRFFSYFITLAEEVSLYPLLRGYKARIFVEKLSLKNPFFIKIYSIDFINFIFYIIFRKHEYLKNFLDKVLAMRTIK